MVDYFDVDGSKSGRKFVTLCENIITCGIFEALIFSSVQLVKSKFDIVVGSIAYTVIAYILLFQSIAVITLVLYMSFRHNCIYVCDNYIEIKDGLLLYRLLYKRKIYYSDIIECRKYIPKSNRYHANVRYTDLLFRSFSQLHPYYSAEYGRSVVIYRRTFGSYVFSPEDQEGFINAVNRRLHKSADPNPS